MSRRKPYPRVVYQDEFQRVTFRSRDVITVEQARHDAMGDPIWIESDIKIDVPPMPTWFIRKLLNRLLVISRRRARRRKS